MIPAPFGPEYDIDSAALKKHRRAAKAGIAGMSRGEVVAYANAVEAAVLAKQKALLKTAGEVMPKAQCASGTFLTGATVRGEIGRAVAKQQHASLLAHPAKVRRERTPAEWQRLYDLAMADKRERQALAIAA